jgi:hypothetical protein
LGKKNARVTRRSAGRTSLFAVTRKGPAQGGKAGCCYQTGDRTMKF